MQRYFAKCLSLLITQKIPNQVNTLNDVRVRQRTLDKLVAWANTWDMDFNANKRGVMHVGKRNLEFQYQMNDGWCKSIDEEGYLEVLISKDLNHRNLLK